MADCPLCATPLRPFFHRGVNDPSPGDYQRCPVCSLIVVARASWPTPEFERQYYRTHENHPEDASYQRFLGRLIEPLEAACPAPADGLDWGCGPHPVLANMLGGRGYRMQTHDPVFGPDRPAPGNLFDLITCTEVLEHLHEPLATLRDMATYLHPGGTLAIMTGWPPTAGAFHRWHYRRDPTHVAFYGPATLRWIAERAGWELELSARDIALFHIPGHRNGRFNAQKREVCNENRAAPATTASAC